MELIGSGFLARHLRPLSGAHPGVTVLAAGVPRHPLPDSAHERERRLVEDTVERCLADGHQLVFFSTVSMYGAPGCRGLEDEPVAPLLPYGQHKLDLETLVRDSGVHHLILRLGYVLGPGEPEYRLLSVLVRRLRAGQVAVQEGARRDLLHVDDFVGLFDQILRTGADNETVNVASGDCAAVTDILDHMELRLGTRAERLAAGHTVSHCPSVAKLHGLVPEAALRGFGPGYFRSAIDRYLAAQPNPAALQAGPTP
ncbi:NAD-dependent epimerase/dehydratase family protein [Streptomyces virginiae]|uniref:NAD-dependent epimerase/dehydratase family protein n=1 Tax=Streptomyces virginiae TaxID=1961 RepID=UPI00225A9AC9|nr:NAD-dependent epimerase/dehydratase family protein [Streptomyces virginiae]MCX5277920.1 NAD-dependent epimerase/dehydratase family protein [Streptomyces virginiae]